MLKENSKVSINTSTNRRSRRKNTSRTRTMNRNRSTNRNKATRKSRIRTCIRRTILKRMMNQGMIYSNRFKSSQIPLEQKQNVNKSTFSEKQNESKVQSKAKAKSNQTFR